MLLILLVAQAAALLVIGARLARGRHRVPPVQPDTDARDVQDATVSVIVPARNEAARIGPCLAGLRRQGAPLAEVIVVDGHSTDGTAALVAAAAAEDPRIRLMPEPPRPPGMVGRPWAIAAGCEAARGEWAMVVDADAMPKPGMVAGAVGAARRYALDAVSFAPRIVAPGAGARWLQPAFLVTLVYRFGAAGALTADPERTMANGQCLLMRRDVLERAGGYWPAVESYCDDVRMARHLATAGARIGFLDGPELFDVEMYPTARETWRAWPRSLNLRDATRPRWRWLDALVLLLAQALPLPLLVVLGWVVTVDGRAAASSAIVIALAAVNLLLLALRLLLSVAIAHSFTPRGAAYWLAPLADPAAAVRVVTTMFSRPREWRGAPRDGGGGGGGG